MRIHSANTHQAEIVTSPTFSIIKLSISQTGPVLFTNSNELSFFTPKYYGFFFPFPYAVLYTSMPLPILSCWKTPSHFDDPYQMCFPGQIPDLLKLYQVLSPALPIVPELPAIYSTDHIGCDYWLLISFSLWRELCEARTRWGWGLSRWSVPDETMGLSLCSTPCHLEDWAAPLWASVPLLQIE